jgi:hypothetical protein
MAVKQKSVTTRLLVLAFVVTVFMLLSLVAIGILLDRGRENYIDSQVSRLSRDFSNMQAYDLLAQSYDDKMACLAFESKLIEMDYYVWQLGEKIDSYRSASEEFQKDQYYISQKKLFNENEIYYMLLLNRMTSKCNLSKHIILFFYQNSVDCKKCDDQSFILRDINLLEENDPQKSVAVFSFDYDLNITTINLLTKYYQVDQFPCIIIDGKRFCGITDRQFIITRICEADPAANVCTRFMQSGGRF